MQATRGIVLHAIKYGETSSIVQSYTREFGRMGLLLNGVRKSGKKRAVTQGMLHPLALLDFHVSTSGKGELKRPRSLQTAETLPRLTSHPEKRAIAFFIAEILYKCLKAHTPEPKTFDFAETFIRLLEASENGLASLHLIFLMQLSRLLGFFPDTGFSPQKPYFDLYNGHFIAGRPNHHFFLDMEASAAWYGLMQANFSESTAYTPSYPRRQHLLEDLLSYYRLHVHGFGEVKSLYVLQEIYRR